MRIHIGLAGKYNQKKDTFVGYVDDDKRPLRAVMVTESIKKRILKEHPEIEQNIHRLHAITLYLLLKNQEGVTEAIICADYNTSPVFEHLSELLARDIHLISLKHWRDQTGEINAKSLAHGFINKLHEKSKKMKNLHRKHKYFEKVEILKYLEIKNLAEA